MDDGADPLPNDGFRVTRQVKKRIKGFLFG